MSVAFTRQLGHQPGIQLNPLRDGTDGVAAGIADQAYGIAMRATRGRIDKPFKVNRSNIERKLGRGESLRQNALNEAHISVYESVNKGAYEAIVFRLTKQGAAKLRWIVVSHDLEFAVTDGEDPGEHNFGDDTEPKRYMIAIRHLECFNDGIRVLLHADRLMVDGADVPNTMVTLRLQDSDGTDLFEFSGSLDIDAKNDYGQSVYLPDVVQRLTSDVEVLVGQNGAVQPDSGAFGFDDTGRWAWAKSDILQYFVEGSTAYSTLDYVRARQALHKTDFEFAYLASGGTQAHALLAQLAQLGYDTNRQLKFDVPGTLSPEAAIAFVQQLNVDSHLVHAYWAPLQHDDPIGINGKVVLGTSTLNIALACGRNAQVNAKGFSPKNFPIAGKPWPISRTGMSQIYTPSEQELSELAAAKINPVLFEKYSDGSLYVFTDSLTMASTLVSYRKLISVADMSTTMDDWIVRFGKGTLQLPMEVAIKKVNDFLEKLFAGAKASGWLVPSKEMGGAAYQYEVKRSEVRPADQMILNYWLCYDGVNRQMFVQQTLSR